MVSLVVEPRQLRGVALDIHAGRSRSPPDRSLRWLSVCCTLSACHDLRRGGPSDPPRLSSVSHQSLAVGGRRLLDPDHVFEGCWTAKLDRFMVSGVTLSAGLAGGSIGHGTITPDRAFYPVPWYHDPAVCSASGCFRECPPAEFGGPRCRFLETTIACLTFTAKHATSSQNKREQEQQ
jgi:hypothetical protein